MFNQYAEEGGGDEGEEGRFDSEEEEEGEIARMCAF